MVHGVRSVFFFLLSFGALLAVGCASVPGTGSSSSNGNSHGTPPPDPPISVSVSPPTASLQTGQTQGFTPSVVNDTQNRGVTWSLAGPGCDGAACGSVSANSSASGVAITYTAPSKAPQGTVTLTATSVTDASKSFPVTITITPALSISVTVSPSTQSLETKHDQSFMATVQNDTQNKGVTWSLSGAGCNGATCGTLSTTSSASGASITYTAPAKAPNPPTVTLTAASVSDNTKIGSATITVTDPPVPISVSVSPSSQSVTANQSQSFTATVQNDSQNQGVTWTLSGSGCTGAACGTLSATSSASGTAITYTAPATLPSPATVTLKATSVTDSTSSGSATITVVPGISVSVSPSSQSVAVSQSHSFTATVQNDSQNQGVNWTLTGSGCTAAACGTLSATSSASGTAITYTAPASVPNPATVQLTATSISDSTKTASATIDVTFSVSVSVSPSNQSLVTNESRSFTATVQNDPQSKGVRWTLSGAGCTGSACGTLSSTSSSSGSPITYIAPPNVPNPATVNLTATSVSDSTISATATITVFQRSGTISVNIHPKRAGLTLSQTLTVTADVLNDPSSQGVTWTSSGGTFTNVTPTSALYHAPNSPGVYTVTATSAADVTRSSSATIGVTDLAGVTTYHNNLARDGVNNQEYALTLSNVNTATFGKLFSCPVDADVYAQPLWVAGLMINGQKHNVVFAATSHNTVYAFDADISPCVTYWTKQLIPMGETWLNYMDVQNHDIKPDLGILGTPVIDLATSTMYLVTKTKNQGTLCAPEANCHQRIHALSLIDGSERFSGPVDITSSITVPGKGHGGNGTRVPFDVLRENQRCGLALLNNVVYVVWASHADWRPYHGWVMGFNKSNLLAAPVAYNTTSDREGGGIWMSGGAPAVDSDNNLYVISGNGDFYTGARDLPDSFIKLGTTGGISVLDWFTRAEQPSLTGINQDLGSGGAAVLADLPSSPVRHLVIGGGKSGSGNDGEIYVLNRDAMGHLEGTGAPIVQKFPLGRSIYATPVFWENKLFLAGLGSPLVSFILDPATSQFNPTPSSSSLNSFGFPGSTPSLSANGSSQGIVWALNNDRFSNPAPTILHAYDANDLSKELWKAWTNPDQTGNAVKFTVPTVANGKVYVGTTSEIGVYGLLPD